MRQEGYTELLGDIVITCTGGPIYTSGAYSATTDITVYVSPSVPITSRILDASNPNSMLWETLLTIDEPGSGLTTGATGNYGPNAPQVLCASPKTFGSCPAYAQKSGDYPVATSAPAAGSTNAANVYPGYVGDFGANSVTFYAVPMLPPAYNGVTRVYRISNIRVPVPGSSLPEGQTVSVLFSTSPTAVLPVGFGLLTAGTVGSAMTGNVNSAPADGKSPFYQCQAPTGAALTGQVKFTEGFANMFKTRVAPLSNTDWASTTKNTGTPGQNIPGGFYGGFGSNSESGFIFPALNATVSGVSYTAGLTDFGTRLKAIFTNIPAGLTVYVSTSNAASYAVPGGTGMAPYAVLVAASQSTEATGDGAALTPLSSGTVTGSDGLTAYPLTPDVSGTAAAVWEIVNANPFSLDSLTFSIYVAANGTTGSTTFPPGVPRPDVALSFAPEPGGGTFSVVNGTQGLVAPEPRFNIAVAPPQGQFVAINACGVNLSQPFVTFSYAVGGPAPPSQTMTVTATPSNLALTATPVVTRPTGGRWLSASLVGGTLTISVDPTGLAPSATAYEGTIKLTPSGTFDVTVPVSLFVVPPILSISKIHIGAFPPGLQGAPYKILVSNAPGVGSTAGTVTVTEAVPSGLTLASMAGPGWDCVPGGNTCTRNDVLASGAAYAPITVLVNVPVDASAPVTNQATVSGCGSASASANDATAFAPFTCDLDGGGAGSSDVQILASEALGSTTAAHDLNHDGAVNVADVQKEINAALGQGCLL